MERSPCSSTATWAEDGQATASSAGPAQLGCVNSYCQQKTNLPVGRPRRTKMAKIDRGLPAETEMLKLGRSPLGTILKGKWVSDEGLETPVAIKIFHHIFSEEMSQQVSLELKGQVLRHRNLLCPLGYCLKKGRLRLLYEYMVNGSLDQHLFPKESSPDMVLMSWVRRCSVINGVAAGLHHLHSNGAVHGSIKCSNILLDQDMTARLGDFGYSRAVFTVNLSDITHLPPECCPETVVTFAISEPTFEKDVFFFGSVILEVVCGRKTSRELVDWVWGLYEGANNILEAVDKMLSAADDFTEAEGEKLLLLALACSHPDPEQRPGMQDVVNILAGSSPLPVVPSRNPEYRAAPDESI